MAEEDHSRVNGNILQLVTENNQLIKTIITKLNALEAELVSTESDLEAALSKLASDVTAETAAVNAVIAALKAGQPVTQAQLDALVTSVANIDSAVLAATPSTGP